MGGEGRRSDCIAVYVPELCGAHLSEWEQLGDTKLNPTALGFVVPASGGGTLLSCSCLFAREQSLSSF